MNKPLIYIDPEEIELSKEFSIAQWLWNKRNTNVQGHSARCWKTRCFSFQEFNPSLAQGFCKLEKRKNGLVVKEVDVYGFYTQEEKIEFEKHGYVLLGYK